MVVPPVVTSIRNNEEPRAGAGLAAGQDPAEKLSPSQDPAVRDFGKPDVRDARWPTTGGLGQELEYATGDPPTKSAPPPSPTARQEVNSRPRAGAPVGEDRPLGASGDVVGPRGRRGHHASGADPQQRARPAERLAPGALAPGICGRPPVELARSPEQPSHPGEEGRQAWVGPVVDAPGTRGQGAGALPSITTAGSRHSHPLSRSPRRRPDPSPPVPPSASWSGCLYALEQLAGGFSPVGSPIARGCVLRG